jgi:hypothetical protein
MGWGLPTPLRPLWTPNCNISLNLLTLLLRFVDNPMGDDIEGVVWRLQEGGWG